MKAREFWLSFGGESLSGRYIEDSIYLFSVSNTTHVREVTPESEKELDELRKDKARLDFMIENELSVELQSITTAAHYGEYYITHNARGATFLGHFKTARDAIDSEMKFRKPMLENKKEEK